MKVRLLVLALVVSICSGVAALAAPAAEAARPSTTVVSVPVSPAQTGGVLDGVFQITSFTVNSAGELVANGVFAGTATIGGITVPITTTASAVISDLSDGGSCTILDLTLGPLHLDLLGLVVDLNQVHLVVSAEPGPGNLLGNLLCAVAGLLDGNAGATAVQRLLDLLNGLLG